MLTRCRCGSPGPVRPPEGRSLDANLVAARAYDAHAVLERDGRLDVRQHPFVQEHAAPDPLVDDSRAEVPAVAESRLVDADGARAPDLRLARRRRVHDDGEQMLACGKL